MKQITHREYLTWNQYFKDEWDRPNIVCYYLMRLTQVFCGGKGSLDQFRIPFFAQDKPKVEDEETAKARWFSWLGMNKRHSTKLDRPIPFEVSGEPIGQNDGG